MSWGNGVRGAEKKRNPTRILTRENNYMGMQIKLSSIIARYSYPGGFWIRILGRGISIVDKSKHPPLFGERNGYRRVLRIGKWGIELFQRV